LAQHRGSTKPQPASTAPPPHAPEPTDLALVAAAKTDPVAFAPLYRRYVEPVYRYCYRRVSDPEQAADLTAQIFTKAIEALPKFRIRESDGASGNTFRSWLFAIAHNAVVDSHRQAKPTGQMPDDTADHDPGPEDHAVHNDELSRLIAVLDRIPEQQRQIIELRLAGLTAAEIATALSLTRAAVKSAQTRAYARLRDLLAPPSSTTPGDQS
jgi:RNA polymerase sigma-70 factor, ECF subfamily